MEGKFSNALSQINLTVFFSSRYKEAAEIKNGMNIIEVLHAADLLLPLLSQHQLPHRHRRDYMQTVVMMFTAVVRGNYIYLRIIY